MNERGLLSAYDFKKWPVKIGYAIMVVLIALLCASMLYPFVNAFLSSLKSTEEFFEFPSPFLPEKWNWANYKEGWEAIPIVAFLKNTLAIFAGNMFFSLLFIGLSAFALSHLKVAFKKWVTLYFMSTLMIPAATYIIPNFLNLQSLGLLNSYWAFWLPASANAFNLLLMKNFFDGIHKELFEAARVDGAHDFQSFLRIAVPLAMPIITTLIIFGFSAAWNDFYWPSLVMLDKDKQTLASGIYKYVVYGNSTIPWNVRFAILSMTIVPPLLFFLAFQRFIMRGVNVSGVKG